MKFPTLVYEEECWEKNFLPIGVDEVGRGAFAGPLVAAGVIFEPCGHAEKMHLQSLGINDSKKLSAKARGVLSPVIKKLAYTASIEAVSVPIINRVGVGRATTIAVRKVIATIRKKLQSRNGPPGSTSPLSSTIPLGITRGERTRFEEQPLEGESSTQKLFLLSDAFYHKHIRGIRLTHQKAIIHGDAISLSIAAASIIAKVYRDNLMKNLAFRYPQYGFEEHVGYGTEKHRKCITQFGLTKIHRTAFVSKTLQGITYQ